jgi:aryl-alcohol dehydrogenase-like predicted oxidoreductase
LATSTPRHGNGKSELRFGHVLRTKPRGSFVLSTKVGRVHTRPADPDNYKHPVWVGGLPFEPRFDQPRLCNASSCTHHMRFRDISSKEGERDRRWRAPRQLSRLPG